jgi:hypothetical protein
MIVTPGGSSLRGGNRAMPRRVVSGLEEVEDVIAVVRQVVSGLIERINHAVRGAV